MGTTPPEQRPHAYGSQREGWLEATIEIPRGCRNKYEFDHERGIFRLDRVLYSSVHYPTDYGFFEGTLSGDGDPLDVLVIVEEPTFPGCHVRSRPVATLMMVDEKGTDEKILAVPVDDPRFTSVRTLDDLPEHWTHEIAAFFPRIRSSRAFRQRCAAGWVWTKHGGSSPSARNATSAVKLAEWRRCAETAGVSGQVLG